MRRTLVFLPLIVVVALGGLFALRLTSGEDASALPSVLVGRALPPVELAALSPSPVLDPATLKGPALVNVFASWCLPCRAEHPILMEMAKRVPVHGIAYKDAPEASRAFLRELGDPYASIGVDRSGRAGLEWGVTGVPETFVVDADGKVAERIVGPLDAARARALLNRLEALRGG